MQESIENNVATSSGPLDKMVSAVGSFLSNGTAGIVEELYERDDKLFFSVYTMTMFGEEYTYLGIFGKFFDLSGSTN